MTFYYFYNILYVRGASLSPAHNQDEKITKCEYQEVGITESYFRRDLGPLGPGETCEVIFHVWVSIFTDLPQLISSWRRWSHTWCFMSSWHDTNLTLLPLFTLALVAAHLLDPLVTVSRCASFVLHSLSALGHFFLSSIDSYSWKRVTRQVHVPPSTEYFSYAVCLQGIIQLKT